MDFTPLTFEQCQRSTQGYWVSEPTDLKQPLCGGAFDSRNIEREQIFFAFSFGAQDGHQFVPKLVGSSVKLLVVERDVPPVPGVAILCVTDSLNALHQIAGWRARHFAGKIISLTGSSGKTTLKNWLTHFLGSQLKVQANPGSFNNHIGCPVTLLALRPETEVLILEMGTSGTGELELLSSIAPADVTMLLNIGHAHLGKFGSRDALIKGKLEIFGHQREGGVNLIPALRDWSSASVPEPKVSFGGSGDYWFEAPVLDGVDGAQRFVLAGPQGRVEVEANHLGPFVPELLCAIKAVCDLLGDFEGSFASLAKCLPEGQGRSQLLIGLDQSKVIDDSYNANPESVVSLWQTMAAFEAGRYVACIGNLAEMDDGLKDSINVLREGLPEKITDLFLCGDTAGVLAEALGAQRPGLNIQLFNTPLDMRESVLEIGGPQTVIGIKGSRTSHMERLVLALTGAEVSCTAQRCGLLLNCKNCPKLGGAGL